MAVLHQNDEPQPSVIELLGVQQDGPHGMPRGQLAAPGVDQLPAPEVPGIGAVLDGIVDVVGAEQVLGGGYSGFMGKGIRRFYIENPEASAIGVVERIEDLPEKVDRLILSGKSGESVLSGENAFAGRMVGKVVLLSPSFAASSVPEEFRGKHDAVVVQGEFAARLTSDFAHPPAWLRIVQGAELYLPGWEEKWIDD